MTTTLLPLIHILPISLTIDRNPQPAARESRIFLMTGVIRFPVRGDNLPQFASDFSRKSVFLSQLTTGHSWEDPVHLENQVSIPTDNPLVEIWEWNADVE